MVRGREEEREGETESGGRGEAESRALEAFRGVAAYVLLGSPGAGKTEAFRREAGWEGGHYITARDFLTFDPEPEWEGRTICIDGLDEMRAGASGGRTPFDRIRAKLKSMGSPPFRISCREADWFGANDRERLNAVVPNGEVQVLRLDPLSDHGVLEILERNHDVTDPAAFVAEARERGVEDLLRNPQNLRMLAEAVAEAEEWPRTRAETFDMACRKLVAEENPEHQIACSGTFNTKALLDGAGDLCALLLLAGKAGVTLPGTVPDANHPRLDQVPGGNRQLLRRVVGTNLFAMPSEGRLATEHRQIAEFLAARRLADLVADGLPAARVFALMTGFDGGIISEFRGLAAWLAAQSKPARGEIIGRDPLGVLLYGDVQQFTAREKSLLFRASQGEIAQNPWLASYTSSDSPLRSLVGPGLEDDMRQALTDPARDDSHQSFVRLIAEAIRDAAPLPELADPLMAIVRDESWRPTIRFAALEAYMRARDNDPRLPVTLRELLDDVYTGVVATQDDDLLGTLLAKLYPDALPVADVVGYLREPKRRNLWTRYGRFWTEGLIEKSTVQQMVQLLDLLRAPIEQVRAKSPRWPRDVDLLARPPIVLLRHLLQHESESVSLEQVFHWLGFAESLGRKLRFNFPGRVADAEYFANWLSDRPDIQKAIVENGVNRCRGDRHFFACMGRVKQSLFGASPPQDYGIWCAGQALDAVNDTVAHWFVSESAAFVHNAKGRGPRQREAIARKLRDDARLTRLFDGRLESLEEQNRLQEGALRTPQAHPAPNDGRFDELRGLVGANAAALHDNQCRRDLLHDLARAYLGNLSDVPGETPEERLRAMLGSDDLHKAALAGLRGAVRREDLPAADDILELAARDHLHLLAYPFMVGLEERFRATNGHTFRFNVARQRLALVIHYVVPRLPHIERKTEPPRWLQFILTRNPEMISGVWARCLRLRLLNGETLLPDTYELAHDLDFAPLARAVAIRLLKAFPVRCRKEEQLTILRSLLQAACLHGDRAQFLELIERKLAFGSMFPRQRVYWLAAGLFMQPESYGNRLESNVSGKASRIRRLAEMTVDTHAVPQAIRDMWGTTVLERLIRLIGPYSVEPPGPGEVHWVTLPIQATRTLPGFIDRLAEDTSAATTLALESLASDERLVGWRSRLLDRLDRQKGIRREATFAHPSLEQVAEVLDNRRPASAADLAAITTDILATIARDIRDGANSGWRDFWNVDSHGRVTHPRPENRCRDQLGRMLVSRVAVLGVDVQSEAQYADDKRADIRLSVPGYNIPVEIKRSCHDDWWSSIKTQLIAKYTRDPGTDGYGIYLVFWFGEAEGCRAVPASGRKPKSPDDIRQVLLSVLSDQERRKISVCVIDVSKPED